MANATGGARPPAPQYSSTPKPKATPSPASKTRVAPMQSMTEQQRQDKALKDLMKKRAETAKKTGVWPNYYTN